MEVNKLVDHLFRTESGKILSALVRVFGLQHIQIAEDVVQESLLEAIKTWPYRGVPDDPPAWLYQVAKNKALNVINRDKRKQSFQIEISRYLQSERVAQSSLSLIFSDEQLRDGQLRMLFTCCHPSISQDSQVALALKTLCGFSIDEVSRAFLSKYDTINRRLVRARQKIREANIPFEVPHGKELDNRLQGVLETIYFMFSEGYNASTGDKIIRYDLCLESTRLAQLIAGHPAITDKSAVNALLALMLLNASRFNAREYENGIAIELADQDRSLWNQSLIAKGFEYLQASATGDTLTKYHILATISACHCSASSIAETDWNRILSLYDDLLKMDNSPMVFLNRTVAINNVLGPEEALEALQSVKDHPSLVDHHLLYATEGSFYAELGYYEQASSSLEKAASLCPSVHEKHTLKHKLEQYKYRE